MLAEVLLMYNNCYGSSTDNETEYVGQQFLKPFDF